jgi:glycosyltransferase involved in cell wall biosynthesis
VRIGLLSNLSAEKGLHEALELAQQSTAANVPLELHLAGPIDDLDRDAVEDVCSRLPDGPQLWGPVFGEDKDRFFRSIDLFVFPTRYENEAQPLVLLEAMAYGRPVIAFSRGCIEELLTGKEGVLVPVGDDFVGHAIRALRTWQSDHDSWIRACKAARSRYMEEAEESRASFEGLYAEIEAS